jgi:hypothetical protein
MWNKGGMKIFLAMAASTMTATPAISPPVSVSNNNVTLESYGNLGPQSSVHVTTLDFENGCATDEIFDADVNEKRRRDEILRRRVRPRTEDTFPRAPIPPVPSPLNPTMSDAQDDHRSATPVDSADISEAMPKKFRLASDLSKTVSTSQIGEKVMDTTVQLSVHEILAVSSEISGYLHDQTRKRRIPVDSTPTPAAANAASLSSSIINADVNSGYLTQLYACPSAVRKLLLINMSRPNLFWIMARRSI